MTQAIVPKELLTATPGGLSLLGVSGGVDGYVLTQQPDGSYAPEAAASGGISGSVGATDNRVPRSDGTTGGTLQASGVTIDDSNNMSGVAGLTVGSLAIGTGTAASYRLSVYEGLEIWNSRYGYQMALLAQGLLSVNNDVSTGGHLKCTAAGKSLQMQSGTGARAGNATLVAGTVTVTNTTVTAKTHVYLTVKTAGGTLGTLSYTLSAGASFTINSSSITETSIVTYFLIEVN